MTVSERVEISGTVNIILTDGVTLTTPKGIDVPDGSTLNIYGQSKGTGKLVAQTNKSSGAAIGGGSNVSGGNITIYGGDITVKGVIAAGIGGGYKGSGGNVVITGGNVCAVAGYGAEKIGKGYSGNSSGTLTDGKEKNAYLHTISFDGISSATTVKAIKDIDGNNIEYSLNDVYTTDDGKLYIYLPTSSVPFEIVAGGTKYICNRNNTFYTEHLDFTEANCLFPSTCAGCGKTVGETTEHSFVDGVCSFCGQDTNGHFYISTAKQLVNFAKYVNLGNKNANAKLMADIDLSGYNWETICETELYYKSYGGDLGYAGTFDGNGHVIKNISVTSSTTMDASCGLFGTVSGTIKNLGVEGFTFVDGGMDIRTGAM